MDTEDLSGDLDYTSLGAGESCGVVNDVRPAGDIVRDLVRDARASLEAV